MLSERLEVQNYKRGVTSAERSFARSPFSIVTLVAQIKGNVSEEMLKNAVAKSQKRHALLRVRIKNDNDHGQWFTSEGVQNSIRKSSRISPTKKCSVSSSIGSIWNQRFLRR